jgi:hypothetical protein
VLPRPADEYVNLPGCAFAAATSSRVVAAGKSGRDTMQNGLIAKGAMATKSRCGS